MIRVVKDYIKPLTTRSVVATEGAFCTSEVKEVVVSTVEVDDWVTVENEVTFD